MNTNNCSKLYTRYESRHKFGTSPFWMDYNTFENILECYSQPHRYFHTFNHITYLWDKIDRMTDVNECWKPILYVIALFHDVVYDPVQNNNEEQSVNYYKSVFTKRKFKNDKQSYDMVIDAIRATIGHKSKNSIIQRFLDADMSSLYTIENLMEMELQIFKEFQHASVEQFRKGRIQFLHSAYKKPMEESEKFAIDMRIQFWKDYKPRIGIFVGTFNKFHVGHMNILGKAEKRFDKVIVAAGINVNKKDSRFEIGDNLHKTLPFHQVILFDVLTPTLFEQIKKQNCEVSIIRGFRSDHDIPFEINLLRFMEDFNKDITVSYIACDREYDYISSSAVNSLIPFNPDPEVMKKYYPTKYDYFYKNRTQGIL